jgi:UDP-glucose 4-epimerase
MLEDFATIREDFALVYLVAAAIPYGSMNSYSDEMVRTNIGLPLRVAEKFQRCRLVYVSSVSVYGNPLCYPVSEEHPYNNPSAYGLSKLAGEIAVSAHPNHTIQRLSSLYGGGMKAPSFLPLILRQAQERGEITLFGDGSRQQDFLHVQDAARMLVMVGGSQVSGTFNLVNGTAVTNLEAATVVAETVGNVRIRFSGEDHTPSGVYTPHRWQSAFGVLPEMGLRAGIREMIEYEE